MPRSTLRRAILAAALLSAGLPACGSAPPDDAGGDAPSTTAASGDPLEPRPLDERTELVVTVPIAIEGFAQVLLADHFGEFERENLDVRIETVPGNEAIALMSTGRADVQAGGPSTAFFNAIASGLDLAWVASNYVPADDSRTGLWLNDDMFGPDGEPDPERLRSATLAFGGLGMAGTPTLYEVVDWLERYDVDIEDIDEQHLNGADMLIAMENGSIDGGWILDPFWLELERSDTARFVAGQSASVGGYIVGPSRTARPDAIHAFFRALLRTTDTYLQGNYHEDPDVVAALAEIIGVDAETITATPPLVFVPEMRIDPDAAERVQQEWFDLGLLEYDEPLAVDEFVDQSPVEAVLGRG